MNAGDVFADEMMVASLKRASRPHRVLPAGGAECFACETGERPLTWGDRVSLDSHHCAGCRTVLAALALRDPDGRIWFRGEKTLLESFRDVTDEVDPIRVTVERELARRAGSES